MNQFAILSVSIAAVVALVGCEKKPEETRRESGEVKMSDARPPAPPPDASTDAQQEAVAIKVSGRGAELQRGESGLAAMRNLGFNAVERTGPYMVTTAALSVPDTLTFKQKVIKHAEILEALKSTLEDAQARKKFAIEHKRDAGMLDQYLAAEEDESNTFKALAPYAIGSAKAKAHVDNGYKLTKVNASDTWEGEICNKDGQCAQEDPIVALFMMLADAIIGELKKDKPFGPNNDLWKILPEIEKFIDRPLGGPNSDLVKIRDSLLAHDSRGELSKLLLDPAKRPVEIVQNIRDGIVAKENQGEIAKAIRDPIKCTIGHLWGGC